MKLTVIKRLKKLVLPALRLLASKLGEGQVLARLPPPTIVFTVIPLRGGQLSKLDFPPFCPLFERDVFCFIHGDSNPEPSSCIKDVGRSQLCHFNTYSKRYEITRTAQLHKALNTVCWNTIMMLWILYTKNIIPFPFRICKYTPRPPPLHPPSSFDVFFV